jgi:hypothetical protein
MVNGAATAVVYDGSNFRVLTPTAASIGALPITGGTITGPLAVNGTITGTGNINASGNVFVTGGVTAGALGTAGDIHANTGTIDAAFTVTGQLRANGGLVVSGDIVGATYVYAHGFHGNVPAETLFYEQDGSLNIAMLQTGYNHYSNLIHQFNNRGATVQYAQFNVSGTFNQTGSWGVICDESVKENIRPYSRGLDAVLALKPVSFQYARSGASLLATGDTHYGLLAQDVMPVIPEMVKQAILDIGSGPADHATLTPTQLVYVLINAVKELTGRVEQLEGAAAR